MEHARVVTRNERMRNHAEGNVRRVDRNANTFSSKALAADSGHLTIQPLFAKS